MHIIITTNELREAEAWEQYCDMQECLSPNRLRPQYNDDLEIELSIREAKHLGLLGCVCHMEHFQSKHGE